MSECAGCAAELAHCHGTLIWHGHVRPECTDPACQEPELFEHAFVVDCQAVGCDCGHTVQLATAAVG